MPPDRNADLRRYVRWTAVLDALEQDLDRVDRQLASAKAEPLRAELPAPEDIGPLPEGLTARAQELARRQAQTLLQGEERMTALRRQLRLGEELRAGTDPLPVYLDAIG